MSTYPGANSTYIPNYESSGKLMVDYARNPSKFSTLQWTSIVKTNKQAGRYLKHNRDEATRIASGTAEFVWQDGAERPVNTYKDFEWKAFLTERLNIGFELGDLGVDQAEWGVIANYAATAATKAMTLRAFNAASTLSGDSDIPTDTAGNLGGGAWDDATVALPYIAKTLSEVKQVIHKNTGGAVMPSDMVLVVSPDTAKVMSDSLELRNYIQQGVYSRPNQMKDAIPDNLWGLPPFFEGLRIVVEDAVKSTNKRGASHASTYIFGTDAYVVARPGGIETTEGTFSTIAMMAKEEMTTETFQDVNNRRSTGNVVEDYEFVVTAPYSAYKITGINP